MLAQQQYDEALAARLAGRRNDAATLLAAALNADEALVDLARSEPRFEGLAGHPAVARWLAPGTLLDEAMAFLADDEPEAAIDLLHARLRAVPDDAEAWYVLACAAALLDDAEASRAAARHALSIDPEHEAASALLGSD